MVSNNLQATLMPASAHVVDSYVQPHVTPVAGMLMRIRNTHGAPAKPGRPHWQTSGAPRDHATRPRRTSQLYRVPGSSLNGWGVRHAHLSTRISAWNGPDYSSQDTYPARSPGRSVEGGGLGHRRTHTGMHSERRTTHAHTAAYVCGQFASSHECIPVPSTLPTSGTGSRAVVGWGARGCANGQQREGPVGVCGAGGGGG